MRYRWSIALMIMLGALGLSGAWNTSPAQGAPELWLIAHGDTVLLQVPEPPMVNEGFVVYRAEGGGEWELLTPEPVIPLRDPLAALSVLGPKLRDLMAELRISGEMELLRRLRADRFTEGVMSSRYREVAIVLGRFYADIGVEEGSEYEYRVVFLDSEGGEGGEVRSGRVRVRDELPGTPAEIEVEAGANEVTLEWSYPRYQGAPTDFVSGFHIYRAVGESGEYERVTPSSIVREDEGMRWVDTEVENDVVYYYLIRAVDIAGREGPPSEEVTAQPVDDRLPRQIHRVLIERVEESIRLTWAISPEPWVVGYWIERATDDLEAPFERLNTELVPAEDPRYRDDQVRGGSHYFYRVIAVDDQGRESTPSNPVNEFAPDLTPPEPVVGLRAVPEERKVHVEWEASPSDDVLGYHIYRGEDPDLVVRLTSEPIPETRYFDEGFNEGGLRPGGKYLFRVAAVDESFNESELAEVWVEIPDNVPPEPATGFEAVNRYGRYVELWWSASPSLDVEYYELVRSQVGEGAEDAEIGTYPADQRKSVRDTTAVRGTRYLYTLTAVDSAGNRGEPVTTELEFRDITRPPAPRHATAVAVEGGVEVRWERVVARDLVGYRVYRSSVPTGVYEPVSEVIEDPRVFIDRDGEAGHFYTVRAVDRSGNESKSSPAVRAIAR